MSTSIEEKNKLIPGYSTEIDYESIKNPAHKKAIKDLVDQAIAMASRSPDDKNFIPYFCAISFAPVVLPLAAEPSAAIKSL